MGSIEEVRARLFAQFAKTPDAEQGRPWADLWDEDFIPWDRGMPNPALEDTLKDRSDLLGSSWVTGASPRRKRALVPGCGRGYDVLLLASFGYDAYGLDISSTAIAKCNEFARDHASDFPPRPEAQEMGRVAFLVGDFFKEEWLGQVEGGSTFDLIYDYTFLSALPPSLRPAWSQRYLQLLSEDPFSRLVCVEFPSAKPPATKGPPFGLPPKVYVGHLGHPGEQLPYDGTDNLLEDQVGPPSAKAIVRVAHWQPERTHEIGKGTDWVSIWKRQA
ncbi:MAG: hypothetical protein M1823_004360 [Watsoniomyces obsoletus]|nr:MAG: hypothetical protein M1823_004360 [Watsoniomyces obsoletus]